ncbi:nuclear transport factor 2 family protein [Phyllobacterium sp. 22229]|uniref:Nuclear transport factor 2 family protein n=1 Tax=Agrobacterium radiobacter TaxID=362 RepID=A0ABD5LQQ1_AGRRD
MSTDVETAKLSDLEVVIAMVQVYVYGMWSCTILDLSCPLFDEAVMFGAINDAIEVGSIRSFYDYVDQQGSAAQMKAKIDVLDMTSSSAVVLVAVENDATGTDYIDYHTLIKIGGS